MKSIIRKVAVSVYDRLDGSVLIAKFLRGVVQFRRSLRRWRAAA